MKSGLAWAAIAAAICFGDIVLAHGADEVLPPIEFALGDNQLAISAGGSPVAVYVFRDAEISRPYFAHLHAPEGVQVSRRHPPREGQDATDHAQMHPGLWLAFGDLSGADSWRLKAPVKFGEFVERPTVEEGVGRFAVRLHYSPAAGSDAAAGAAPIAEEICRYRVANLQSGYLLTCDSEITALADEIVFGDQEEMGFGVRIASELTAKAGGQIANANGQVNEKEVWGKTAAWCDYRGVIGDHLAGVLVAPHPENFRPSWFHARDYGVLVANPFGRQAFGAGEPSRIEVKKGDSLRLRFAALMHAGTCALAFDAESAYAEILEQWRSIDRAK